MTDPERRPSQAAEPADGHAEEGFAEAAMVVLRSAPLWIVLWIVSRGLVYREWAEHARFITNDVKYYYYWLGRHDLGWDRLVEYPVPVVWVLGMFVLPTLNQGDYVLMFALGMATLDALFSWALYRRGQMWALLFWIAFITCYGGLLWFRYDMVPALVVGLAALWVTRQPRAAGALVGAGAALKLWPALLMAPLIGRHRPGWERVIGFTLSGGILALLSFLAAGQSRLVSPLTWQSGRGLQIESIPATLLMWRHARAGGEQWDVHMSKYNAFEIFGPGVAEWSKISDISMVLAVMSAVGMALVVWWRRAMPADVLALAMVAIVCTMLVANKTFSPQYLLWLGTPLAALVAESRGLAMRLISGTLALLALPLAWLTQQVYPRRYGGIIRNPIADTDDIQVLVVRNLLLVGITAVALAAAWWALLRRPGRPVRPLPAVDDSPAASRTAQVD